MDIGQISIFMADVAVRLFALVIALISRETITAYMAYYLGDKRKEILERKTISPIPHVDKIGTLLFPLGMVLLQVPILIGWAKPLHYNPRYFKSPQNGFVLITLTRMAINFVIAFFMATLLGVFIQDIYYKPEDMIKSPLGFLLTHVIFICTALGIFNVLPFPGSDMWNLILTKSAHKTQAFLLQNQGLISIALFILFFAGAFHFVFNLFFMILQIYIGLLIAIF